MSERKTKLEPLQVTIDEAAELLSHCPRWVRYQISNLKIKTKKDGRSVRIAMTEVRRVSKLNLGPCRPRTINQKAKVQTNG